MTSYQQLQEDFNYYIFSATSSKELKDAINSQQTYLKSQFQKSPIMYQKRQFKNLEIKQQMRINGQRYALAHKILKKSKHFELFYKDIDYTVQIMSFSLNTQAFLVTIELLGTKKQVQHWRNQVFDGKIIGAYGQTQLGHGSNVQSLETQAHYNEKTQTFIINTPKTTGAKFWPGLLGTYATHCVLQAKTYIKGKSIGIQTFVFQFRDKNLQNLPGIESGDIGPKLGFHRVDNGYLKITNVHIPRESMLMKYIKVESDGKVLGLQNKQVIKYAYGSMLNLRVKLTNGFSLASICKSTMDLYCIHLKQGVQSDPEKKKPFIENMCTGFGFVLVNNHTLTLFNNFLNELQKQDYNNADNWLISCHIVSSTLKALSAWKAIQLTSLNLTNTRKSSFNVTSIPHSFIQYAPAATYEGDNSVLLQQTAKYMMMKQAEEERQLTKPPSQAISSDIQGCFKVLEYITSLEIKRLKILFEKQSEAGTPLNTFWNQKYQREIIQAAKLWGVKTSLSGLLITLKSIDKHQQFYEKICKVFTAAIIRDVPHLAYYGFTIKQKDDWKSFSEIQQRVIMSIDYPLKRGQQFMDNAKQIKLIERNKQWMKARL